MGVARTNRASSSAPGEALSKALNYRRYDFAGERAARLEAQQQQQQHELWRASGSGFPQRCIDMAQDNVLAECNGHGRALAFLLPDGDPKSNIDLLGHYLAKLGDCGRGKIEPALSNKIRACAELCAHYLLHTSWFAGEPAAAYAHLANKLCKFPDSGACLDALDWIARQALQARDLGRMGDWKAATLVGALAKNVRSEACRDATLRAVHGLLEDGTVRAKLGAVSVSMLLNALSKWPTHDDAKRLALQLADLLAATPRLRETLDKQGIANCLNALSKWPQEKRAEQVVLQLAGRLATEPDLRLSMWGQELINSMNALSKWAHCDAAKQTILLLADRLATEPQLRQQLNASLTANGLNALSKVSGESRAKEAALLLADRIAADPRLLEKVDARKPLPICSMR